MNSEKYAIDNRVKLLNEFGKKVLVIKNESIISSFGTYKEASLYCIKTMFPDDDYFILDLCDEIVNENITNDDKSNLGILFIVFLIIGVVIAIVSSGNVEISTLLTGILSLIYFIIMITKITFLFEKSNKQNDKIMELSKEIQRINEQLGQTKD